MPAFADTKAADSLERLIAKRPARRALWEAAEAIGEAVTSARLYAEIRRKHADIPRATFFRALKFLVENGLLNKAVLPGGNCVYQRSNDSRKILWICEDCSRVRLLESAGVAEALREVAHRQGFDSGKMIIQVHGHCGCV